KSNRQPAPCPCSPHTRIFDILLTYSGSFLSFLSFRSLLRINNLPCFQSLRMFRPNKDVRTFAEQLLHAAGTNYVLISAVKGTKVGAGTEDPPRQTYKTKADVVALLKKSVEDGAALIKEKGAAGLAQTVKDPYGNRMVTCSFIWMETAEHAGEHYGQLVVYYRLNGIVPPASRPRK